MKLPIPSLKDTHKAFCEHASAYKSYEPAIADEFFTSHAAELLQERLLKYDAAMHSSYLERNWNFSYLGTNAPLAVASNFCFKLPKRYELDEFICAFAALVHEFDAGLLEYKTPRGEMIFPLQFSVLKGGCRRVARPFDSYSLNYKNSCFFSILKNGELFYAPLFDEEANFIRIDFEALNADSRININSLAKLSFFPSDEAASHYARLQAFNAFFDVIENSRFNLCIVNEHFNSLEDEKEFMHYFAPCYHYKTLNFIYNEDNGSMYINGEHSFLDGGTIAYILEKLANFSEPISAAKLIKAHKIEQFVDEEYIKALEIQSEKYSQMSSKNASASFVLNEAAANGFSKDFIMQAAIAYAASAVYKKPVCQYEAVDVREFDYGRTECVRAISKELLKALESFLREDFLMANQVHKNRIKACKKGFGIDRHLLALQTLAPTLDAENAALAARFFASDMYKDTTFTITSTSSLGKNNAVDVFNFHPVCDDGLGVSYAFYEGKCEFCFNFFKLKQAEIFSAKLGEFFSRFNQLS